MVTSFILGISVTNLVNSLVVRLGICNPLISAKSYTSLYSKVKLLNLLLIFLESTSLLRLFLAGKYKVLVYASQTLGRNIMSTGHVSLI